jgi:type IV pilus assembly protein PilN
VIRINLMPRAEARRRAGRQRARRAVLVIASTVACVIVASELITRARLRDVEHALRASQGEVAELERMSQEARELDRARAELAAKLATIQVLERRRSNVVRMLEDLSEAAPEKLWLTEMRESGGDLTIAGRGLDDQTIATFLESLEGSASFSQVDLVETKQVEEGQAKLKEFAIRAAAADAPVADGVPDGVAGGAADGLPGAVPDGDGSGGRTARSVTPLAEPRS